MFSAIIRVRYQETDQMGIAHHASYFGWLEVARTEFMRSRGLAYAEVERRGVVLPVVEAWCRYQHSVRYDQELSISVQVRAVAARVEFEYHLHNENGQMIAEAGTIHAWTDRAGRVRNPRRYGREIWEVIVGETSA